MSEMKRTGAREANERRQDRFASTLVIAAAIIAAVRGLATKTFHALHRVYTPSSAL